MARLERINKLDNYEKCALKSFILSLIKRKILATVTGSPLKAEACPDQGVQKAVGMALFVPFNP